MGKIICAFAGLGKTFLSKKYYNKIIDFDLQNFKYIYKQKDLDNVEKLKGVKNKVLNKNWPDNYIAQLKKIITDENVILVPADKEVRDMLVKNKIDFIFVLPSLESKEKLIARYKQRGNNQNYIQRVVNDLEEWININYDYETIILNKNEFLEEWLLKNKVI